MAIKTITTTVGFADPHGTILANGLLTLDLSQPAIVTGAGGDIVPLRVSLPLDSSGLLVGLPVNLWANDQLTPNGTTYHMRVFNSNGLQVADYGNLIIQGTAPIDLSQIQPVSVNPTVSVTAQYPQVVARFAATAQTGTISGTLYAVPSGGAGLYRATIYCFTSVQGSGGTVQGDITYNNGAASITYQTPTAALNALGNDNNSSGVGGDMITFYSAASQNISYAAIVSAATGSPQYDVYVRLEFLN